MAPNDELQRHNRQWLLRRRRIRRLLRHLPRRANLARYPVLKWFAAHAAKASFLWSFKRANVMPSLYAGSVLAFLPLYGLQLFLAFGAALGLRGNLTVMVALQFVTNPFTIVPVYGFTGWIGYWVLGLFGLGADLNPALRLTNALFVGGVVTGIAFALLADLSWRFMAWEAGVFRRRLERLRKRAAERPEGL